MVIKVLFKERILLIIGSTFTFAVGCIIIISAVLQFDNFMNSMTMQVAPPTECIIDMISDILVRSIFGIVLIPYSVCVFINSMKPYSTKTSMNT